MKTPLEQILSVHDHYTFFMVRRDGSYFTGNVYKSKNKAMSDIMQYFGSSPMLMRGVYLINLVAGTDQAIWIDNPEFVEDEKKAREIDDTRATQYHKEIVEYFQSMAQKITNDKN